MTVSCIPSWDPEVRSDEENINVAHVDSTLGYSPCNRPLSHILATYEQSTTSTIRVIKQEVRKGGLCAEDPNIGDIQGIVPCHTRSFTCIIREERSNNAQTDLRTVTEMKPLRRAEVPHPWDSQT